MRRLIVILFAGFTLTTLVRILPSNKAICSSATGQSRSITRNVELLSVSEYLPPGCKNGPGICVVNIYGEYQFLIATPYDN